MNKATEWQQDAQNVKTAKVQYWRYGVMTTAQMTNAQAQDLVRSKLAYVISAQAIGFLNENGERRG